MADASERVQAKLIAALVERIDIHRDRLELALRGQNDEVPTILTTSATLIRSGRQNSPSATRSAVHRVLYG